MTTLNTFQDCLIQFAGYTGATGATGAPGVVVPGFQTGGFTLAGSKVIGTTGSADIAVPSTAKTVVVLGRNIDVSPGATIGVYIYDGVSAGFGSEIAPSADLDQQVVMQAFSPDSIVWVGTYNSGPINDVVEAKTEMVAGALLAPISAAGIVAFGGNFTAGNLYVMYQ